MRTEEKLERLRCPATRALQVLEGEPYRPEHRDGIINDLRDTLALLTDLDEEEQREARKQEAYFQQYSGPHPMRAKRPW